MTVGAIDESSMFGLHYELETKMTGEVADVFITMVKELRAVYGNTKSQTIFRGSRLSSCRVDV